MEQSDPRDRVWQIGMDALALTGSGAVWGILGLAALFPHGRELLPFWALTATLLVGASGRCLHIAARPLTVVETTFLGAGSPTQRVDLTAITGILGTALNAANWIMRHVPEVE